MEGHNITEDYAETVSRMDAVQEELKALLKERDTRNEDVAPWMASMVYLTQGMFDPMAVYGAFTAKLRDVQDSWMKRQVLLWLKRELNKI